MHSYIALGRLPQPSFLLSRNSDLTDPRACESGLVSNRYAASIGLALTSASTNSHRDCGIMITGIEDRCAGGICTPKNPKNNFFGPEGQISCKIRAFC